MTSTLKTWKALNCYVYLVKMVTRAYLAISNESIYKDTFYNQSFAASIAEKMISSNV